MHTQSTKKSKLEHIFLLEGLDFIRALYKYEIKRFDKRFLLGSVYEDINKQFGIFPAVKQYPVYFAGDITRPKNKIIFIGINPGYDEDANKKEQKHLENQGTFDSACHCFEFFKSQRISSAYYSNIAGFLRRLYNIKKKIDWDWMQTNFINLELIPYHSKDSAGLRINDLKFYRERYFEALIKIIKYLNPHKPIFINGFSSFEKYFSSPCFKDAISFTKTNNIWVGKIKNKFDFIGLPFLTRVKGGKDKLTETVRNVL